MVSWHSAKLTTAPALLASIVWLGALPSPAVAQSDRGPAASSPPQASAPTTERATSPYRPVKVPIRAKNFYQQFAGIEDLQVRRTASGNLIRFSYRVVDPARAKALGDKNATPYMLGQRSRALLQIPVMEKVGQLRQSGLPEAGREYWMVFSNKGNLIKAGDRVNVMIGSFHADGLVVE